MPTQNQTTSDDAVQAVTTWVIDNVTHPRIQRIEDHLGLPEFEVPEQEDDDSDDVDGLPSHYGTIPQAKPLLESATKVKELRAEIALLDQQLQKDVDVSDWSDESKEDMLAVNKDRIAATEELVQAERDAYERYVEQLRDCVERAKAIKTKEVWG